MCLPIESLYGENMKKQLTLLLTAMMVLIMAVFLGDCSLSSSSNSTSRSSDASEVTITDATGKVSVATNPKKSGCP